MRLITLLLTSVFIFSAWSGTERPVKGDDHIEWIPLEEALALNQKKRKKKKILIDLYTDWCGWCKRMDAGTFSDPEIIEYVNDNYHAVKFNAEQREPVTYKETVYENKSRGPRGTNAFALEVGLSNGRIGYPTLAILDEHSDKIATLPGYKNAETLDRYLRYYAEDYYKEFDFATFAAMYDASR